MDKKKAIDSVLEKAAKEIEKIDSNISLVTLTAISEEECYVFADGKKEEKLIPACINSLRCAAMSEAKATKEEFLQAGFKHENIHVEAATLLYAALKDIQSEYQGIEDAEPIYIGRRKNP